jgi:hypothetical protein
MKIFGPKLKRKGSLQLSINAIVILILAITILGLGLGFIKKQFSSLGEQFEQVSSEIKSEIIEKIRQSGDLLVFNKMEFNVQVGKPDQFYIGIKNTGQAESCFKMQIKCIQSLTGGLCSAQNQLLVSGASPDVSEPWFKLFEQVNIAAGDVGVYPITLQLPGNVLPDTYLMKFEIFKGLDPSCSSFEEEAGVPKPYTTPKQFYLYVR